ncbi:MAG: GNAT family N-acetyltransferase [Oscillospiraceae bacterium]|nr:GNAT family N-acetyltransferase [Oscillospiraceae bacterium]
MNQLHMVKLNMNDIPDAHIPAEYELRVLRPEEKNKWEELCNKMFDFKSTFTETLEGKRGYIADGVLGIFHGDKLIATGTALLDYNQNGYGYVHMIAADSDYSGKKLGYEIVAAVLRRLRGGDFDKSELTTDDFRLPAIKTYCKLGFVPDLSVDETMRERWENLYKTFGWELTEYI